MSIQAGTDNSSVEPYVWDTASLLGEGPHKRLNALVILNTPLPNHKLFKKIWDAASVRYCADGGANRLYKHSKQHLADDEADDFIPDLVKGDLDSIKPHIKEYYQSRGVPIERDPSEYATDLGKCVESVTELEKASGKQYQLIVMGGLSGRLDHTIHTVHALTELLGTRGNTTWVVGAESVACVLGPGKHDTTTSLDWFGPTCGILPIGQEAKVTTSGLVWNLGPTAYMYPTSVAKCVSTSNHFVDGRVQIETDVPVVWTVEVKDNDE